MTNTIQSSIRKENGFCDLRQHAREYTYHIFQCLYSCCNSVSPPTRSPTRCGHGSDAAKQSIWWRDDFPITRNVGQDLVCIRRGSNSLEIQDQRFLMLNCIFYCLHFTISDTVLILMRWTLTPQGMFFKFSSEKGHQKETQRVHISTSERPLRQAEAAMPMRMQASSLCTFYSSAGGSMVQIVLQSNVLGSGHSVKDRVEKLQSSPSQHSGQRSFRRMPQTEIPSAPKSTVAALAPASDTGISEFIKEDPTTSVVPSFSSFEDELGQSLSQSMPPLGLQAVLVSTFS